MTTPVYAAAFDAYRSAGWESVLPLPAGRKKHPPVGYTGRDAAVPSYPDCFAWAEDNPNGNVALRLPPGVIGIDVDHYGDKDGGGTLATYEAKYGPLPATWRTGSRTDGTSGIRLYRVPVGLRWPGDLGAGIEIIQDRHRYAIVWPSIHPDTGGTYKWSHEHVFTTAEEPVPHVEELTELPAAWVDGLTNGQEAQSIVAADLADGEAAGWIRDHGKGEPCRGVERAVSQYLNEFALGSRSRHEIAKDATHRLARMAAEGHRGAHGGLGHVRASFIQAADNRSPEEVAGEWARLLLGAVRIAAADTLEHEDPCDNPLHGLIEAAQPSPSALLGPTPPRPVPSPPAPQALTTHALPLPPGPAVPSDPEGLDGIVPPAGAPGGLGAPTAVPAAPEATDAPRPSWEAVDLGPFLDGSYKPEVPTLLRRQDGAHLVYPGLVHSFHGESESGKSLVAQALAADLMRGGEQVVYVDFESGPGPLAARMLALGVEPDALRALFTYIRPEANPYALAELEAFKTLLGERPALIILDGVTDALSQFNASTKDSDDITRWHRSVPRMMSVRTGAAVILIDHVTKDSESRGRFAVGGAAKMNALDGAAYTVEILEPIGKGMRGKIGLRIGKDRPGSIRPKCGAWRSSDRTQEAAVVVVDSLTTPGRIAVTVLPPTSSVMLPALANGDLPEPRRSGRPTTVMEQISRHLEDRFNGETLTGIRTELKRSGSKAMQSTIKTALEELVAGGFIVGGQGVGNSAQPYLSSRPYRQHEDRSSDRFDAGLEGIIVPAGQEELA